ncbi:hypothetical protein EVAR_74070_1 [Eumeta japonica]|uniref:Uncharacterized protein n=1 Tax=Eumeta variegata TaxID=151549 RepID=A0A4C1TLS3_EUMVA|nr:hypothetical protein EVAR_74070_1 [Eumeta japonica]
MVRGLSVRLAGVPYKSSVPTASSTATTRRPLIYTARRYSELIPFFNLFLPCGPLLEFKVPIQDEFEKIAQCPLGGEIREFGRRTPGMRHRRRSAEAVEQLTPVITQFISRSKITGVSGRSNKTKRQSALLTTRRRAAALRRVVDVIFGKPINYDLNLFPALNSNPGIAVPLLIPNPVLLYVDSDSGPALNSDPVLSSDTGTAHCDSDHALSSHFNLILYFDLDFVLNVDPSRLRLSILLPSSKFDYVTGHNSRTYWMDEAGAKLVSKNNLGYITR